MNQNVYCKRCRKTIETRAGLVTVWKVLAPVSYHKACYEAEVRSTRGMLLGTPINSVTTTVSSVVLLLFCVYLFLRTHSWFFILLATLAILMRAISWLRIERKLS